MMRGSRSPLQGVPNVNLIPSEYRRASPLSRSRLLAILIALELVIAVALFSRYGDGSLGPVGDYVGLGDTPAAEGGPPDPLAGKKGVRNELNGRLADLEIAFQDINAGRVRWPELLDLFFNQTPTGVKITSFLHTGDQISLGGEAPEAADIFTYRELLKESGSFTEVMLPNFGASGTGDMQSFNFQLSLAKGAAVE